MRSFVLRYRHVLESVQGACCIFVMAAGSYSAAHPVDAHQVEEDASAASRNAGGESIGSQANDGDIGGSTASGPAVSGPAPIARAKAPYAPPADRRSTSSGDKIDWMMLPSTYTHDAQGQRVDQYNSGEAPTIVLRNDIQRSGYRHTRSTIQAGFTSDNYHSVEQWGDPVQPYGEWRYPYRPFATPYNQWGPQLPQIMGGGYGWMGGFGPGMGTPYPNLLPGPGNAMGPMQDDYYPQAPILSAPGMAWPPSGPWHGRPGNWNPPMLPEHPRGSGPAGNPHTHGLP